MFRKAFLLTGLVTALVLAPACHNDSNTVTGPMPTPAPGVPTPTPGPGAPTPTPAPAGTRVVHVGQGGGMTFVDAQSGSSTTTISMGTTVHWVWDSGIHSTTSGTCSGPCTPNGIWDSGAGSGMTFDRTFNQAGSFPYFCTVHGAAMTGTVVVQ